MNLIERIKAPTPPFFKRLRNVGLVLTAVSTAILMAPISLPVFLTTFAGYATIAGSAISAVSQITHVEKDKRKRLNKKKTSKERVGMPIKKGGGHE